MFPLRESTMMPMLSERRANSVPVETRIRWSRSPPAIRSASSTISCTGRVIRRETGIAMQQAARLAKRTMVI